MKRLFLGLFAFFSLFLLVAFPESCVQGAKNGLLLWFQVVVPTLLPFLVLSSLLIELGFVETLCRFCNPFLSKPLGISKNGCYPVIIGLISGYPVGAKVCSDLVRNGSLNKNEGQYILAFCNNASPMFIISYIAMEKLRITGKEKYFLWFLLIIIAFLSSLIVEKLFHPNKPTSQKVNKQSTDSTHYDSALIRLMDQTILNSFEILTKVGGYIILFSLFAQIIQDVSILPLYPKLFFVGMLEITTGINAIAQSGIPITQKIILSCTFTAFGGLSALAQTKSVMEQTGLSLARYLLCKLFSSAITFLVLLYVI